MNELAFIQTIESALTNNQTINDYCNEKYNKDYLLFVGIDENTPPSEEQYPVIVVYDNGTFEIKKGFTISVVIGIGIKNENKTETDNSIVYDGYYEIMELSQIIKQSVSKLKTGNSLAQAIDIKYYNDYYFPFYKREIEIDYLILKNNEECKI